MGKKVEYKGESKNADPIRLNFKNAISITDIGSGQMNCGIEYMIGEDTQWKVSLTKQSSAMHKIFSDPQRKFRYVEVGFFPYDGLPITRAAAAQLFVGGEE